MMPEFTRSGLTADLTNFIMASCEPHEPHSIFDVLVARVW